jgi:RNA polymerase sigma-70 factor (ECF subfamily)
MGRHRHLRGTNLVAAQRHRYRRLVDEPEDHVVARAQAGDVEAFAALVRAHHARVYRLALRLTGNAADAEEVVQDAFLRAHQRIADFRGQARFSTWLYRIATNTALMLLRRDARRPVESLDACLPALDAQGLHARQDLDLSLPEDPEASVDRSQLQAVVLEGLARLPDHYRIPFVLRDLEELTAPEVAALLDLDAATVRQRVHRARLMLRGFLWQRLRGDS